MKKQSPQHYKTTTVYQIRLTFHKYKTRYRTNKKNKGTLYLYFYVIVALLSPQLPSTSFLEWNRPDQLVKHELTYLYITENFQKIIFSVLVLFIPKRTYNVLFKQSLTYSLSFCARNCNLYSTAKYLSLIFQTKSANVSLGLCQCHAHLIYFA